mmetsp:Transcript_11818/g.12981  ORF Transcript_11818/g.12981 Transcript_11818/m.12981 type:complete len:110 (+) Transcript_11818:715-1044(+)
MKKFMVHAVRMSQHMFAESQNYFELIGMDFLIDQNLKVWFIEANRTPNLADIPDEKRAVMTDLIRILEQKLLGRHVSSQHVRGQFEPIIDESLKGTSRYFGLLDQECLV